MANQTAMDSLPILFELLLIVLVLILCHFVVENIITVLAPCENLPFTRRPIVSQPIEAPFKVPFSSLSFVIIQLAFSSK